MELRELPAKVTPDALPQRESIHTAIPARGPVSGAARFTLPPAIAIDPQAVEADPGSRTITTPAPVTEAELLTASPPPCRT